MKFLLLIERSLIMIFWVMLIFGFDTTYTAILTIASALIHELGHVICLFIIKSKGDAIPTPNISGFKITLPTTSYKEELACAAFGPLANLTTSLLFFVADFIFGSPYLAAFGILNAMTALSNLLPIEEYDGYKILSATLALHSRSFEKALNILDSISFLFSASLTLLALYVMLKIGEGYWFFAVFFTLNRAISALRKRNNALSGIHPSNSTRSRQKQRLIPPPPFSGKYPRYARRKFALTAVNRRRSIF